MKKLNRNGSALQIVLVTFLIMMFALTSCLFVVRQQTTLYKDIDVLMKQKNLEIFLVEYYVKEMKEGFLLSDYYEQDDCRITSYVDDMGSFYEITTRVELKMMKYEFLVQINVDDYRVLKLEYKEG